VQQRKKKPKQEEAQGSNWLLPGLIGLGLGAAVTATAGKKIIEDKMKPYKPFMNAWNSLTDENKERAKRLGARAAGGDLNKTIEDIEYVQENPVIGGLYIAGQAIANKAKGAVNKVKGWFTS
jgi:hypothetical protein